VQVKGVSPAASPAQQEALLEAAAPFQNAYLAGSLQRMSDAVGAAFPGGNRALPTAADLQKCIGCAIELLHDHHRHVICRSVDDNASFSHLACISSAWSERPLCCCWTDHELYLAGGPVVSPVSSAYGRLVRGRQVQVRRLDSELADLAHFFV